MIIDVIIPVYRGAEATWSCIQSVLSAGNEISANIIIINDASDDFDIESYLFPLSSAGNIHLVTNAVNMGFVHSANKGMAINRANDVVILNSDTVVFPSWLDRLHRAAYSSNHIGTVTPFSNNATICSYPRCNADNPFDSSLSNQMLDYLFASANAGKTLDIPTGVGFCMYIKRACLNDTGPFDERGFGRGYGEENDFCLRAAEQGWRHVLAADVFVPHRGGASFRAERKPALKRGLAVLNARFPGYGRAVEEFLREDPLRGLRREVDVRILAMLEARPLALRVCHNRGGGTARRLREEAAELVESGYRVGTLLPVPGAAAGRVVLHLEEAPECVNLVYDLPGEWEHLLDLLRNLNTSVAMLHHFIDHDLGVLRLPESLGIPYNVVVHDFGWYCPGINLLDANNAYCGDAGPEACRICDRAITGDSSDGLDYPARERMTSEFLAHALNIIVPSHDTAQRYFRRTGADNIRVRHHSDDGLPTGPIPRRGHIRGRVKAVIFGAIGKHKGYDILLECARDARHRDLNLEFVLVGTSMDDYALFKTGRVFVTGTYDEEEIAALLSVHEPDIALYPSVWPETWCFTLDIAFRHNIFPVAFSLGAPEERIRKAGFGALLPPDASAAEINDNLLVLARSLD